MSVVLETNVGDITVDLYIEERPKSCLNFLKLCRMKAFHFNLFHFVQRNFIIQTGDPTGTGRGGESIFKRMYGEQAAYVDAEKQPRIKHKNRGTLSFVNNGSDQIGSQFFITAGSGPQPALDAGGPHGHSGHVVFGQVVDGFDVVDAINETYADPDGRPFKDVRIFHTVVLDDPFDDPEGLTFPDASPPVTADAIKSDRLGVDDDPLEDKEKDEVVIKEKLEEKEAKARATVLELVGDIKDVDEAPPENVLFVCKLNPVTTEEDLQIIFSRFGAIVACDIITDKRTGDSLQYSFIEFEKAEECERAYFKMDNVLIDDRRIHVDFSQSVAKNKLIALREEKNRKRGGGGGFGGKDAKKTGNKEEIIKDAPEFPKVRKDFNKNRQEFERKRPLESSPAASSNEHSKAKIPRQDERSRQRQSPSARGKNDDDDDRDGRRPSPSQRVRKEASSRWDEERKEDGDRRNGSDGRGSNKRRLEDDRKADVGGGDRRNDRGGGGGGRREDDNDFRAKANAARDPRSDRWERTNDGRDYRKDERQYPVGGSKREGRGEDRGEDGRDGAKYEARREEKRRMDERDESRDRTDRRDHRYGGSEDVRTDRGSNGSSRIEPSREGGGGGGERQRQRGSPRNPVRDRDDRGDDDDDEIGRRRDKRRENSTTPKGDEAERASDKKKKKKKKKEKKKKKKSTKKQKRQSDSSDSD